VPTKCAKISRTHIINKFEREKHISLFIFVG